MTRRTRSSGIHLAETANEYQRRTWLCNGHCFDILAVSAMYQGSSGRKALRKVEKKSCAHLGSFCGLLLKVILNDSVGPVIAVYSIVELWLLRPCSLCLLRFVKKRLLRREKCSLMPARFSKAY